MKMFNPLVEDLNDKTIKKFHIITGGHPSRFAPNDISQVYYDVPDNFYWGNEKFYSVCSVHVVHMTNSEISNAFSIGMKGNDPFVITGVACLCDGKIKSNGKYIVRDERIK